jgi:hypothetical protein
MPRFPPGLLRPEVLNYGRDAAGDLSGCRSGWWRDSSAWITRRLNAAGLSRPRLRAPPAPPPGSGTGPHARLCAPLAPPAGSALPASVLPAAR